MSDTPTTIRRALYTGSAADAQRAYRRWASDVAPTCEDTDQLLAGASLGLELGLPDSAQAAARRAAELAPDNPDATALLASITGEDSSLLDSADNSSSHTGAERSSDTTGQDTTDEAPSPGDLTRFLDLFAGRENVYARQWRSGDGSHERGTNRDTGYSPVRRALSPKILRQHLAGETTVGAYVIRLEDKASFFALDVDLIKPALEAAEGDRAAMARLRRIVHGETIDMAARAADLGIPLLMEDSGYKGRHLWGFFERPVPGELAYRLADALARRLAPEADVLSVEAFPKQPAVDSGGLGNLIKLPLGVHLGSGRRSVLLDDDGRVIDAPWKALREVDRLSRKRAAALLSKLGTSPETNDLPGGRLKSAANAEREDQDKDVGEDEGPSIPLERRLASADVAAILKGCPVLRKLVDRALGGEETLNHDHQVVIQHTLGHLADGPALVNDIFRRAGDVPRHAYLESRLRGCPASCRRIHERLPRLAALAGCDCHFPDNESHYPTPLLHADRSSFVEGAPPPPASPVEGASLPPTSPVEGASLPPTSPVEGASLPSTSPVEGASLPSTSPVEGASLPPTLPGHLALIPIVQLRNRLESGAWTLTALRNT